MRKTREDFEGLVKNGNPFFRSMEASFELEHALPLKRAIALPRVLAAAGSRELPLSLGWRRCRV